MGSARLVVAITFLPALIAQERLAPMRTTVCDLLREPEKYNGKLVEIHSLIAADEESSVIFDENCSGSILFLIVDKADSGPEFSRLKRLLKRRSEVTALLSGTFEHSDARIWGHQAAFDSRLLATSVSAARAAPVNSSHRLRSSPYWSTRRVNLGRRPWTCSSTASRSTRAFATGRRA